MAGCKVKCMFQIEEQLVHYCCWCYVVFVPVVTTWLCGSQLPLLSPRKVDTYTTHTCTQTVAQVAVGVSTAVGIELTHIHYAPCACAHFQERTHVPQVSIHSRWDADDMTSCYHDNSWLGKAMQHEPTCLLVMKSPLLSSPLPLVRE